MSRDVLAAARDLGWPLLLKRRRNGYDGYGNRTLRGPDDVAPAMRALQGPADRPAAERALMVEGLRRFRARAGGDGGARTRRRDASLPRRGDGAAEPHLPPRLRARRRAARRGGASQRRSLARAAVEALDLRGVAGVELFLAADGAHDGQRAGAARPQQRALHHRGLRHLAVRERRARRARPAARRDGDCWPRPRRWSTCSATP